MAKTFSGILDGERFTATLSNLTSSVSLDILSWGTPPAFPEPNASFSITLVDGCTDVVAPYGAILRATGFTGFNVSEPAGDTNVYDPTQHKITFIWDFDDAAYSPVTTPNIPTAWRNLNTAYGKQVAHVWHSPGGKTVSCLAFDEAGNWGVATLALNIANPNTFFAGANTILYSKTSNWTDDPTGGTATRCSTLAQVHTALRTRMNANNRSLRVLTRVDQEFQDDWFFSMEGTGPAYPGDTGYNYRDNCQGLHLGTYGTGARPIVRTGSASFGFFAFSDKTSNRQFVVSGFDFRGDWDAATETGRTSGAGSFFNSRSVCIVTRCRFDGIEPPGDKRPLGAMIWHDTLATNWSNYCMPAFGHLPSFCLLGCDLAQNVDALSGINQGIGGQTLIELGNRHGTFRTAATRNTIMSCTSFFNRAGWSTNPGGASGNIHLPTAEQDLRVFTSFEDADVARVNSGRHHHNWERCSFEGGAAVINFGLTQASSLRQSASWARNIVCDRLLLVPGPNTYGNSIGTGCAGTTIRNCYIYRQNVTPPGAVPGSEIDISYIGATPLTGLGPVEVYNNTVISDAPSANLSAGFVPISVQSGIDVVLRNNVVVVPSRGFPLSTWGPLGTSPIEGFACRHKGSRWNFPPIVATDVASRRESAPGVISPGAVAVGEWVNLPYPTYTGNNGAGFTLTRAMLLAQPTGKHQVSVTISTAIPTRRMGDTALYSLADGKVTFDFHTSGIRIQNNSGVTWPAGVQIWVLIDNSSRLMPFKAGTSIAGNTIPAVRPLAGSPALSTGSALPRSLADFFGARKPGSLTNTGSTVPGDASQGAFEPV
jgi:hypothetical protein